MQSKKGAGSATTCMAYAAYRFVKALLAAKSGESVTEAAYVHLRGIPGGEKIMARTGVDYFAVNIKLGPTGAQEALDFGSLSENEQGMLKVAVNGLQDNINAGQSFVRA